jgi:hypothetical protein
MKWTLHHNIDSEFPVEVFGAPGAAIDRACALINEGQAFCWISFGTGAPPVEIARNGAIYKLWSKTARPRNRSALNFQPLPSTQNIPAPPPTAR